MENYLASNIFTPTTQAIHTYIERELLNERLVDALRTPGTQLIVYGLTGSGKSTLLYNKLNQTYEGAISIQCTRETTYEQLLLNAFDQLGPFFTAEKNRSIKEEFGIDFKTIKSNLSQSDNIKMSRILPAQLTPERLIRLFGMSKCCWVIEDFHKLQDLQKQRIAQLMKVFMDHRRKS